MVRIMGYVWRTKNSGLSQSRQNKALAFGLTILVVAIIVAIAGIGGYFVSMNYMQSQSSTTELYVPSSATIVNTNVTVIGQAVGFPCAALRLPCPHYDNQSIGWATLIRYGGSYYYASTISVNSKVYTVWYTNSTYYCVHPAFQGVSSCPSS